MTNRGKNSLSLKYFFSEQEQELQDKQNQDESNQEYVSAEIVQDLVVGVYKSALRIQHHIDHLLSW